MTGLTEQDVKFWLSSTKRTPKYNTAVIFFLSLAAYSAFVSFLRSAAPQLNFKGTNEVFPITAIIQGLLFGYYGNHYISRWWDLRVATGSVGGALADICMLLNGHMHALTSAAYSEFKVTVAKQLKIIHVCHLCEVFDLAPSKWVTSLLGEGFEVSQDCTLLLQLSTLLSQISTFTNDSNLPDPVKFSLLPAMQQNLSTVRSSSGDCTMILNTKLPNIFGWFIALFTTLHLLYLPIFLGNQTGWDEFSVTIGACIGFSLIVGYLVVTLTTFRNPFIFNGFRIEKIVSSTFNLIDESLGIQPQQLEAKAAPAKVRRKIVKS